jgi:hypothetical protein
MINTKCIFVAEFIDLKQLAPPKSSSTRPVIPPAILVEGEGWELGKGISYFCDSAQTLWVAINKSKGVFRVHTSKHKMEGNASEKYSELLSF